MFTWNLSVNMRAVKAFPYLVLVTMALAEKNSYFSMDADRRLESDVLSTVSAVSARQCTMRCLAAAGCMASNWQEANRTCELLDAHGTPVAAAGYTLLTRKALLEYTNALCGWIH